jgi:hypothetical protein
MITATHTRSTGIDWASEENAPARALILAESDRRDADLERQLACWREGWAACKQSSRDTYEEGFLDGLLDRRRFQHAVIADIVSDLCRWGPGGREHFADPRPGDYTGGPVTPW